MHNLLQAVEWSNQKLVGPGLHVYRLATPLRDSIVIGHFRVPPAGLCFKTRVGAQSLIWKSFFILVQIKLIFTRKVVLLASFWKWGFLELGSDLFTNVVTFLCRGGFNLYFLFKGEGWPFVIWPIRVCAAELGMVLRGLGLKKGFSVFNRMCCWTGSF